MNRKYFKLRVKKGTQIISPSGDYTVTEVPDDALSLLERGVSWLVLMPEAVEPLSKLPAARLQKLKTLRAAQGFTEDVELIDQALTLQAAKATEKAKK